MEDAHLALLDVKREGAEGGGTGDAGGESGGGGEEQKEGATDKIRMFGVFDGHGGEGETFRVMSVFGGGRVRGWVCSAAGDFRLSCVLTAVSAGSSGR